MIRKKKLRLLLYDYQRTARYYTIYRAFKQWSSDDFTTILRLFHDYWLRLFQPERYDYCRPLLAIGRKPEKRCGESRQWFRAAGLPRRMEGARSPAAGRGKHRDPAGLTPQRVRRVCTTDSVSALASDPHTVGADPPGLLWSAICCTV